MHTPFDEEWFADLLGHPRRTSAATEVGQTAATASNSVERVQEWGEAPDTSDFVGRAEELVLLRSWVVEERRRVVAVLGIGGMGKTGLAARLAQSVAHSFARVYWRNLSDAPPVPEWLGGAIAFLSDQQLVLPVSESEQIALLLQLLRARQCLLVLDNSETLLESGQSEGRYRAGMDGYGRVLESIGQTTHQSCLLLTSREAPPELALLPGARESELHGLGLTEAQAVLADKRISGDTQDWQRLVDLYGGNGLALKIVGETIRQVYAGDIGTFLVNAVGTYGAVFGGIRHLLDIQVARLSSDERDILRQLAVEREPVSLAGIWQLMAPNTARSMVVVALENLRRRSLLDRGERGATFTLQSLVLEYMTDRLVETIIDEVQRGEPFVLVGQSVIKAQARDYVRQTRERLIGTPIVRRLTADYGDAGAESRFLALLDRLRGRPSSEQGYGPGNVINLLRLQRGHLRGLDLSRITLRQAYLAQVDGRDASLVDASVADSVLAEAFDFPNSVALSGDGSLVAAGTSTGQVWLWRVADRTPLWVVRAHTGSVRRVAFSADGRLLASGGGGGSARVWDTATGRSLVTLSGTAMVSVSVALSNDGLVVATQSTFAVSWSRRARPGSLPPRPEVAR
jgi:hypothetical protein